MGAPSIFRLAILNLGGLVLTFLLEPILELRVMQAASIYRLLIGYRSLREQKLTAQPLGQEMGVPLILRPAILR